VNLNSVFLDVKLESQREVFFGIFFTKEIFSWVGAASNFHENTTNLINFVKNTGHKGKF